MWVVADGSVRFPELGLEIEHLADGIEIFGIHISFYGILIAFAMLVGLLLTEYIAKKSNQNAELYLDFAIFAILSGIVGARAGYVLFHWERFREVPEEILRLQNGGLSFFGGLFAGLFAAWLFCRRRKYEFLKLCDTAVAGVLAGQIIGRWGDFFNRDMIGTYSGGLLAMQVEAQDVDAELLSLSRASFIGQDTFLQVHPVFLYEILWNVALFVVLVVLFRYKKFSGEVFFTYLFGYGLVRFWTEFLRVDKVRMVSVSISGGHIVAAAVMTAGLFFLVHGIWKLHRQPRQGLRKQK